MMKLAIQTTVGNVKGMGFEWEEGVSQKLACF